MKLEDADRDASGDGRPPSQRARVHAGREATRRRTTDGSEVNVREPPTMKVSAEASDRGVRRKRRCSDADVSKRVGVELNYMSLSLLLGMARVKYFLSSAELIASYV